ncbi:MAG: lmo0937 family membrane protein [Candidatus Kapaibacterium sp.]
MLSNIIVFAVLLWVLGVTTSHTLGGFIYLLLVIAAVALIIRAMQRRRVALKGHIITHGIA